MSALFAAAVLALAGQAVAPAATGAKGALTAARAVFERNLDAIARRDRAAYL